jgi:heme-degrading monooxygenase HmoA
MQPTAPVLAGHGERWQARPVTHDGGIAATPDPPYTAVIFTSVRTAGDRGYAAAAAAMDALARQQPGYLGVESAREGVGITVSYWRDEQAARAWKRVAEHLLAQRTGRDLWYEDYRVRVATVVRDYGLHDSTLAAADPRPAGRTPVGDDTDAR